MNRPCLAIAILLGLFSSLVGAVEEVWTGDRVIDSSVAVRGKSLRIEPGARIAFKGGGRLIVEDGDLVARRALFAARSTLTNDFRIVVQNGKVDLSDCRFSGLKAFEPDKRNANFIHGFLRNQHGHGSRIVHCTFADCSALMILNAAKVEVSRNLAIRCDNAFSFLNCTECRIEFNEFFNASSGLKLNSTMLSECFRNRFTDCDAGLFIYCCKENRVFGNAFFGGKEGLKLWMLGPGNVFSGNRFEGVAYPFSRHGPQDESNAYHDNASI